MVSPKIPLSEYGHNVENTYIRLPGDSTHRPEVDVAIVMESTYPFLKGGVSAVVHDIVTENPDLSFGIIHIAWDSNAPSEDLYNTPKNVAWIDVYYLSLGEVKDEFLATVQSPALKSGPSAKAITESLMHGLYSVLEDNPAPLWQLYDEAINPLTRTYRLWPAFSSPEMMEALTDMLSGEKELTLGEMFWIMRDYFSIVYSLVDRVFPKAAVYHAHTTGYASLVSACAARQHNTSFLLTEHNLYVRDTVNTLLERRMDLPVTRKSYREITSNTFEKIWTRWWTEMGAWLYPSTDHITYLYPAAIKEAIDLGGDPSKSEVLPNGMLWEDFEDGRRFRTKLLPEITSGEKTNWKFCCIARVVPIKGIMELIDAVKQLVDMGHTNFTVDVLGPTEHIPEYYEKCKAHIEKLGVGDNIFLRGTVNVREVLHHYDALVLSSFNEGQPIVVLEAMACGLPVMGTRVGGMDELVENELAGFDACGILVEPGDTDGLANGIATMMNSASVYETWTNNSLDRLKSTFLMHTVMKRYNDLYRRLGAAGIPAIDALKGAPQVRTTDRPTPDTDLNDHRDNHDDRARASASKSSPRHAAPRGQRVGVMSMGDVDKAGGSKRRALLQRAFGGGYHRIMDEV